MLLFSLDFYTPASGNKYTNTDHALTQATTTAASNQSLIHIYFPLSHLHAPSSG